MLLVGIDFDNCKYIFTQSSDEIGTDIASYARGTKITNATTQIEQAIGPAENWYLHVLATDKAGNKVEAVSENGVEIESTAEFPYTGSEQTANLLAGKYKLECWGASGGNSISYTGTTNAIGGYGGYSVGVINFSKIEKLYIYTGQTGDVIQGKGKTTRTSYNGGGSPGESDGYGNISESSTGGRRSYTYSYD